MAAFSFPTIAVAVIDALLVWLLRDRSFCLTLYLSVLPISSLLLSLDEREMRSWLVLTRQRDSCSDRSSIDVPFWAD